MKSLFPKGQALDQSAVLVALANSKPSLHIHLATMPCLSKTRDREVPIDTKILPQNDNLFSTRSRIIN